MRRYQAVVGTMTEPPPKPYPQVVKEMTAIENDLESCRPGVFAALLAPALAGVVRSQSKREALHDVAGVLVTAPRARLGGTSLAESLVPEAVPVLPGDPFTDDKPLLTKRTDDGWVVYSVGPDGGDDGGPVPAGADPAEGNDDIGLRPAL